MADRRAGTLELRADRAGVLRIGELEWQRFDIQCEQRAQRRLVAGPLCALLVAVYQLEQGNSRDADALAIRELLCEPAAGTGRALVEHRDDRVRVQAFHAWKKTRLSGTTGGSSSGPASGKGSPARSRSISAKTAATSAGLRAIGSRITRWPTRLTRTSFPGSRNSLGSRTAWLRPWVNSLAVLVSPTLAMPLYDSYRGRY